MVNDTQLVDPLRISWFRVEIPEDTLSGVIVFHLEDIHTPFDQGNPTGTLGFPQLGPNTEYISSTSYFYVYYYLYFYLFTVKGLYRPLVPFSCR